MWPDPDDPEPAPPRLLGVRRRQLARMASDWIAAGGRSREERIIAAQHILAREYAGASMRIEVRAVARLIPR